MARKSDKIAASARISPMRASLCPINQCGIFHAHALNAWASEGRRIHSAPSAILSARKSWLKCSWEQSFESRRLSLSTVDRRAAMASGMRPGYLGTRHRTRFGSSITTGICFLFASAVEKTSSILPAGRAIVAIASHRWRRALLGSTPAGRPWNLRHAITCMIESRSRPAKPGRCLLPTRRSTWLCASRRWSPSPSMTPSPPKCDESFARVAYW